MASVFSHLFKPTPPPKFVFLRVDGQARDPETGEWIVSYEVRSVDDETIVAAIAGATLMGLWLVANGYTYVTGSNGAWGRGDPKSLFAELALAIASRIKHLTIRIRP